MTEVSFYGHGLPRFEYGKKRLPGKLVVLEGTDGVGRSTQIALLREWLESEGYAVKQTGLTRGQLAGKGIKSAMQGHTLGDTTMNLLYATDFADRLEQEIIPALRAGFVVLTDRYIYSIIARAQARGGDPAWLRNLFGFALIPDAIYYLQADLAHLIPRVVNVRGFDYWESGADFLTGRDLYDSYLEYQTRLLAQFEAMTSEFGFQRIDANRPIAAVFRSLRREIAELVKGMKPPKKLVQQLKDKQVKAETKRKAKEEAKASAGGRQMDSSVPDLSGVTILADGEPDRLAGPLPQLAERGPAQDGASQGSRTWRARIGHLLRSH
jgi:dTMP kinase